MRSWEATLISKEPLSSFPSTSEEGSKIILFIMDECSQQHTNPADYKTFSHLEQALGL